MNPTTIHQLALLRQADYQSEADRQRLAALARHSAGHDRGDALASLRRTFDQLIHPLRTTGTSPA